MNLEELKARAKAAVGTWGKSWSQCLDKEIRDERAYREAADPTTILSLIEEIERLRGEVESVTGVSDAARSALGEG